MMIKLSLTSTQLFSCSDPKPLIPFEAWTGVQPQADWLHLRGCDAYAKDLKVKSKIESRSENVMK